MRLKTTFLFTADWRIVILVFLICCVSILGILTCSGKKEKSDSSLEKIVSEELVEPELKLVKEGKDLSVVTALCSRWHQRWEIKYCVYTNSYHLRGYVIISDVIISQDRFRSNLKLEPYLMVFTYSITNIPGYIENIHKQLIFDYKGDLHELRTLDTDKFNIYKSRWGFSVLRTAEDIVRACMKSKVTNIDWDLVNIASEEQRGRKSGISFE